MRTLIGNASCTSREVLHEHARNVKHRCDGELAPHAPHVHPNYSLHQGRAAMLGFAFSLVGEVLTGKGALAQLGCECQTFASTQKRSAANVCKQEL